VDPNIKIEAFDNGNLVAMILKLNIFRVKGKCISGIYGSNKPSLFYKINNAVDYSPVNGGLIVLNNLNSGNLLTQFTIMMVLILMKFLVLILCSKTMVFFFWMTLLYLVLIGSILFIYYRWNKMRYVQNSNYRRKN
jgi:hypothetical protein